MFNLLFVRRTHTMTASYSNYSARTCDNRNCQLRASCHSHRLLVDIKLVLQSDVCLTLVCKWKAWCVWAKIELTRRPRSYYSDIQDGTRGQKSKSHLRLIEVRNKRGTFVGEATRLVNRFGEAITRILIDVTGHCRQLEVRCIRKREKHRLPTAG